MSLATVAGLEKLGQPASERRRCDRHSQTPRPVARISAIASLEFVRPRPIALGRRSWLFCGSDRSGLRAAAMNTLNATTKFNHVDPQAWLVDVPARIAELPGTRVHELVPWNWRVARHQTLAA